MSSYADMLDNAHGLGVTIQRSKYPFSQTTIRCGLFSKLMRHIYVWMYLYV